MKHLWKATYTLHADFGSFTANEIKTAYVITTDPSIPSIQSAIQSTLTPQYRCWEVTRAEYLGEIINPPHITP